MQENAGAEVCARDIDRLLDVAKQEVNRMMIGGAGRWLDRDDMFSCLGIHIAEAIAADRPVSRIAMRNRLRNLIKREKAIRKLAVSIEAEATGE